MPLTVVYLLVKLTSLVCFFSFFQRAVINAVGLTVLLNTCFMCHFILLPLVLPVFSNK